MERWSGEQTKRANDQITCRASASASATRQASRHVGPELLADVQASLGSGRGAAARSAVQAHRREGGEERVARAGAAVHRPGPDLAAGVDRGVESRDEEGVAPAGKDGRDEAGAGPGGRTTRR